MVYNNNCAVFNILFGCGLYFHNITKIFIALKKLVSGKKHLDKNVSLPMNIFTCFFSGVRFHKTSKLQLIHNHFCSHSFSLLHLVETKKWCTLELKYLSCIRCLFWECTDQMSMWWLAAHREDRLKTRFHQVPWTFLNILEFQKVYSRLWKSWNFIYVLSKLWNIRVCFVHFKDWVSFTVGFGNSGNLTFGLQRKNIFLVLLARSQSGQIHQWFTEISDISIMRFQPGSIITGKEHVSWIKFTPREKFYRFVSDVSSTIA